MKSVLVTGGTGFIGRHCLLRLKELDADVHVISSRVPAGSSDGLSWHYADLLEATAVERVLAQVQPTHLLHLAWFVEPGKFWNAPENVRWLQASLGLLQAFAHYGGIRAVVAGTCAEYDWTYGFCSEAKTPLVPASLYGITKHSLQLAMTAYAQQVGLSTAWGRVFFPYGPHEPSTKLVAMVTQALLKRQPVQCTEGRQYRDFLHVEDVADAFATLLRSNVSGAVNIGSGQPVQVRKVISTIAQVVGDEGAVEYGALPTQPHEPPLLVADVARLTHELGWSPQYSLRDGIEQTVRWWQQMLFAY